MNRGQLIPHQHHSISGCVTPTLTLRHTSPVIQPRKKCFHSIAKESFPLLGRRIDHYFISTESTQIVLSPLTGENTIWEESWELLQPSRPAWNLSQPLSKLLKSMLSFQAHGQIFGWAGTIFKCGMQNPTQWLLQWEAREVLLIYNNAVIYGGTFSLNQNLRLICSPQAVVS